MRNDELVAAVGAVALEKLRPPPDLKGEVPSLLRRPSGCEFHTRCPCAQERCRRERPQPQLRPPGQTVRCHFPLV